MISPDTLTRHELIGLPVRVADADSDAHIGIAGRVLRESTRTLTVRTQSGDKRVPKAGTTFEFALVEDDEGTIERTTRVDRDGETLFPDTEESAGDRIPADTEETAGDRIPADTDEPTGVDSPVGTDEAAGVRKAPGSTSQLGSDTTGVRPRQSGPSASDVECDSDAASRSLGECKDVVYVTVDGQKLLSRPAERTERGVSTWR